MPGNDTSYFEQKRAAEEASLARQRRAMERRATEQLAAGGALYSGQRGKAMGAVEQDYMEAYRQRMMDVAAQEEAARQAQLGREWQTGERLGGEAHQQQMAQLQDQFQTKYLNMGYDQQTAMQMAQAELAQTMQQAGFGQEQTMGQLQFGWQGALQGQAQEAQRQLASDEAYYRSYLQDQVNAGQMDMQTAQNMYNQWSQQAAQQYGYAQQMAEQQYGYGMQGLQNQWDVYGQTLGYQHQAGLAGMGIEADWNTLMAQQQFTSLMAQYGFDLEQATWGFQDYMRQMNANSQYHLQHLATDTGGWTDALGGLFGGIGSIIGMTNPWNWGE